MGKADRIAELFPAFYQATDRTKLVNAVVRWLASPLEEADTHLFRIQRAHRLTVAEHGEDIVRLAAVLGLTIFHFEDILADPALPYDAKLTLLRDRVQRVARVHLKGLGTPWAVLEAAATFLNATIVPKRAGGPLITHLDAEAFSHEAVLEFTHPSERPRDRLYLHENPWRRRKVEPVERWPRSSWAIDNRHTGAAPVKFVIRGVEDRTVLPSVYCPDAEEGILFYGVVPDGLDLVMDANGGALLGGEPVDEWLIFYRGGAYDFGDWDSANTVEEEQDQVPPFDGNVTQIVARPFRRKRSFPAAPQGRSTWYFHVAQGVYEATSYDFSVWASPTEPIGVYDGDLDFDECVFAFPASGVVGMAWDERIPCSFKLLLPAQVAKSQPSEGAGRVTDHVGRLASILPRFRAAGVRAYVDAKKETWILGESTLRNMGARDGGGVDFHAPVLRNHDADVFVPVEPH